MLSVKEVSTLISSSSAKMKALKTTAKLIQSNFLLVLERDSKPEKLFELFAENLDKLTVILVQNNFLG